MALVTAFFAGTLACGTTPPGECRSPRQGRLVAVAADTGAVRWSLDIDGQVVVGPTGVYGTQGVSTEDVAHVTPLTGMTLTNGAGGGTRDTVVSIDTGTGKPGWRYDPVVSSGLRPDLVTDLWLRDGTLLVHDRERLTALDPATGTRRWQLDGVHPDLRPPTVTAGTVIFTAYTPIAACL